MTRGRIVIAALALAAVVAVVVALARPREVVAPEPSQALPSAPASQAGAVVEELADGTWWRIGWRPLDADGPPDWEELTIGRMSGEILGHVQLGTNTSRGPGAGGSFATGPRDGLILYTRRVENVTELHVADTVASDDRRLAATRAILYHADIAPRSGFAYFVTGPRNPGIWRVALDGGHEPELIANPEELAAALPVLATAPIDALPRQVTLRVDEATSRLAILFCEASCTLRVIDLVSGATATLENLDVGMRELTSFDDGVAVIAGTRAYDVETGLPVPMPADAHANLAGTDVGWELPDGWRLEQRQIQPNNQVIGPTWYVAIGPDGEEVPIEVMGQGIGQG